MPPALTRETDNKGSQIMQENITHVRRQFFKKMICVSGGLLFFKKLSISSLIDD